MGGRWGWRSPQAPAVDVMERVRAPGRVSGGAVPPLPVSPSLGAAGAHGQLPLDFEPLISSSIIQNISFYTIDGQHFKI